MSDIERKLESRIDRKLFSRKHGLDDGFKKNKVVNEVLDKPAVMTLYKMIKDGVISYVNGAVGAGKESVLFWGVDCDGRDVALKVYLVTTSNFKRREQYISGDPRFQGAKRGTRNLVHLWARKEYRNLRQCHEAGVPVPEPLAVANNVLAMRFVGEGGRPASPLLESEVTEHDYSQAIGVLRDMYRAARLVHGDYSEYNIFKTAGGLVAFDLGSAVDLRHPSAAEFLQRDINNITRFFGKRGVAVDDPETVRGEILG